MHPNLPNPLELHPVLANICTFLTPQDLIQSRLVSKFWLGTMDHVLSKRNPGLIITLKSAEDLSGFLNNVYLKPQSFCFNNVVPSLEFLDHRGRDITRLTLNFQKPTEITMAKIFNETPNLKYLELSQLPHRVIEQKLFDKEEFSLQFLKSLTLNYMFRSTNYSKLFLSDIFRMSPNLEELKLNREIDYGDQIEELKVFACVSEHNISLKHLELSSIFREVFPTMNNFLKNSRLKVFICKQIDQVNSQDLKDFLDTHKHSLVRLEIGLSRCSSLEVQFPFMESLEVLALCFHHYYATDIPSVGTLMYGAMFPSLKKLKISVGQTNCVGKEAYIADEIFPDCAQLFPSETLQYIELPANLKNPLVLYNIVKLFPNIEKLNVASQNNAEVFKQLWLTSWNKTVEIMNISLPPDCDNFPVDYAISGASEENCLPNPINSICSFAKLKCLVISAGPMFGKSSGRIYSKITDISILSTLVKMTSLRRLIIELKIAEISDKSIDLISSTLNLKTSPLNKFGKALPGYALQFSRYDWQAKPLQIVSEVDFDLL